MAARRKRGGSKPWQPTAKQRASITKMSSLGVPVDDIADAIGVSDDTLRKHCMPDLKRGRLEANMAVAQSLFERATDPEAPPASAIWWSKSRMGWKETTTVENVGEGGGPIQYLAARENLVESIQTLISGVEPKLIGSKKTGD